MVRSIMQDYTNATSIACIFVDIQGKERSSKYNFTKFCHFMRSAPEFRSKCYQCDLCGGLETFKNHACCPYRCHAGLIGGFLHSCRLRKPAPWVHRVGADGIGGYAHPKFAGTDVGADGQPGFQIFPVCPAVPLWGNHECVPCPQYADGLLFSLCLGRRFPELWNAGLYYYPEILTMLYVPWGTKGEFE